MEEKKGRQVTAPAMSEPSSLEQPKAPARIKTTLGALGPRLPIGIPTPDGKLLKDFTTRPWRTKDERALGKQKKKNQSMANHVSVVLTNMLSKVGPFAWDDETKLEARRVHIQQFFMADVFYMYCYLRAEALGEEIQLNLGCPSCGHKFKFDADLNTIEVMTVEHPDAMNWTYKLRVPIVLRKKDVTSLQISSTRWGALDRAGHGGEELDAKLIAVVGSIVGFNDDPAIVQLDESEIDELSKRDLEMLMNNINDRFLGPKMAVETTCPKCEEDFNHPIDWRYESFFTLSSR